MPLLLTVEEAAKEVGLGRTTMFGLVSNGTIESVKIGSSRRIPREALEDFVARLRSTPAPAA